MSGIQSQHADVDARFSFGENWREFLHHIDDQRIEIAEKALQSLLGQQRLDGLTFLDVGSGSGLSSLAARRLGGRVHSFDYDPQSVACTMALRDRYCPGDALWVVEQGSILDPAYLAKLGRFDIVYSWGVLHHTGSMHEAIARASSLVAQDGTFAFALYRKTRLCRLWTMEKRWYTNASKGAQHKARRLYVAAMRLAFVLLRRNFKAYVSEYRSNRGMSFIHDVHDWMGGYPYESICPDEVARNMQRLRFDLVRSKTQSFSTGLFGSGCDEFVYRRTGA